MNDTFLLGQILWYEVVGLLLCLAIFSVGGLLYTLLLRSSKPRLLSEVIIASYPLGLLGVGLLALLARTGTLGQLASVVLIVVAGLWTRSIAREQWQPLRKALPIVLLFAVAMGALFGTLWHGPGPSYAGDTLADMAVYNAYAQFIHYQLFPVVNLNTLGDALPTGYINLFPALLAAATSTSFADDAVLFYAVSGPVVMIVSFGLMAVSLAEIRARRSATSDGVTVFQLVVAGVLMVGAWRYPSWVVETPPVTLALPLCISMYYYAMRPAHSAIQNGFIVLGSVLTKVVTLVPFGALTVGSFFDRATLASMKRSHRIAFGAALGAAFVFAVGVFLNYRTLVMERMDFFWPDSLHWLRVGGGRVDNVGDFLFEVALGRDLGLVLLILAAVWSRHRSMFFVTLTGTLAYFASASWFRWPMTATIILFAITLTQNRSLFRRSRVLVVLAALCLIFAALRNTGHYSREGLAFLAFWLVWIVLFALLFGSKEVWSRTGAWHRRSRFAVKLLSAFAIGAAVWAVFSPSVHEVLDNRRRPTISRHTYDIQRAVRRHTPREALIFVERILAYGAHASTFASYGRRQVFFSGETRRGWVITGLRTGLRSNPEALESMRETNYDVLFGRKHPHELKHAFPQVSEYEVFFAILRVRRKPPPHFRPVYSNGAMTLYEIGPEE